MVFLEIGVSACARRELRVAVWLGGKQLTVLPPTATRWSAQLPVGARVEIVASTARRHRAGAPAPGLMFVHADGARTMPREFMFIAPGRKLSLAVPNAARLRAVAAAAAVPPVHIWLPSYTAFQGCGTDVLLAAVRFASAFNDAYAAANVRIVGITAVLQNQGDWSQFQALAAAAPADMQLGITLNPSYPYPPASSSSSYITRGIAQVNSLNASNAARGLPPFTHVTVDYENIDPALYANVRLTDAGSVGQYFLKPYVLPAVQNSRITHVGVTGSTKYTGAALAATAGPAPGVSIVGTPEIYDLDYVSCAFPALSCRVADACGAPATAWSSVADNWFPGANKYNHCVTPAVMAALTSAPSAASATSCAAETWPMLSLQAPCAPASASVYGALCSGVSNPTGTGCNNFGTMTLADVVSFLGAYRSGVQLYGYPRDAALTVAFYEVAFLPTAWFVELGVSVSACTTCSAA